MAYKVTLSKGTGIANIQYAYYDTAGDRVPTSGYTTTTSGGTYTVGTGKNFYIYAVSFSSGYGGWTLKKGTSQVSSGYTENVNYNYYGSSATTLSLTGIALKTYTLRYDANGGSGAPSSQTGTSATGSYTFTISYTKPTRSGYTFLGWSTSSTATAASYVGGDDFTTSITPRTIYAVWEEKVITYTVNTTCGAGVVSITPSSASVVAGKSKTFTAELDETYYEWREGSDSGGYDTYYQIKQAMSTGGWTITSGSGSFSTTSSTSTSFKPTSDSTIKAKATENTTAQSYRNHVTYNANGGSGSMSKSYSNSSTTSSSYKTVTISSNTFTRTGYDFSSWNTKADGSGTSYAVGSKSINANVILYAQWKAKKYNITINTVYNSSIISQTVWSCDYGTQITRDDLLYVVPTGYKYDSCSETLPYTVKSTRGSYNPIIVYVLPTEYTFNLYLSENYSGGGTWKHLTGTGSTQYRFQIPTGGPTRDTYVFNSWNSKQDGSGTKYVAGDRYTMVYPETTNTFYAQWDTTYDYNLQYWSDGVCVKSISTGSTSAETYTFTLAYVPTKTSYKFLGWDTSSTASTVRYNTGDTITLTGAIKSYVYLYAVWKYIIPKFWWDGKDGSTDRTIIDKGLPISNLKATNWNGFKYKIRQLNELEGKTWSYSASTAGDPITAGDFNNVRTGISNLTKHGILPAKATVGGSILASDFYYLRDALNEAIEYYNDTH